MKKITIDLPYDLERVSGEVGVPIDREKVGFLYGFLVPKEINDAYLKAARKHAAWQRILSAQCAAEWMLDVFERNPWLNFLAVEYWSVLDDYDGNDVGRIRVTEASFIRGDALEAQSWCIPEDLYDAAGATHYEDDSETEYAFNLEVRGWFEDTTFDTLIREGYVGGSMAAGRHLLEPWLGSARDTIFDCPPKTRSMLDLAVALKLVRQSELNDFLS